MIQKGWGNSRMKDLFDIWTISQQFELRMSDLAIAVEKTFKRRGTSPYLSPAAFDPSYASDPGKQTAWANFHRQIFRDKVDIALPDVVQQIERLLRPVLEEVQSKQKNPDATWPAGGPWIL